MVESSGQGADGVAGRLTSAKVADVHDPYDAQLDDYGRGRCVAGQFVYEDAARTTVLVLWVYDSKGDRRNAATVLDPIDDAQESAKDLGLPTSSLNSPSTIESDGRSMVYACTSVSDGSCASWIAFSKDLPCFTYAVLGSGPGPEAEGDAVALFKQILSTVARDANCA